MNNFWLDQARDGGFICATNGKPRECLLGDKEERKAWFAGYDSAVVSEQLFKANDVEMLVKRVWNSWFEFVDGGWVRFVPNQVLKCSDIDKLFNQFQLKQR